MMNSRTPKVSVIIPCFNDKDYILEALNSVEKQTFDKFEIIIVDDGSEKETKRILSNILNKKVHILTQSNLGLSAARNNGIKISKGEYILTLDADDRFEKTFLEKAVKILDTKSSVGAVSCFCNIFINNSTTIYKHTPKGGDVNNFLFDNNSVSFSLFRKECWQKIGGFDETMKNGFEDWDFWISLTKNGWQIYNIPEYLFDYRQKEKSMVKDSKMYFRESNLNYIFKKHKELYIKNFEKTIDFIFQLAERNKRNKLKYKNSIDYKIGNYLLKPIRFIKKILKG